MQTTDTTRDRTRRAGRNLTATAALAFAAGASVVMSRTSQASAATIAPSVAASAASAAPAVLLYAQRYDLADAETTTSGSDVVRVDGRDGSVDVIDRDGGARRIGAGARDPAAQCGALASGPLETGAASFTLRDGV